MRRLLRLAVAAAALWLAPGAVASGWCGSGETSVDRADVVTGAQVHAIVVDPADSADTFVADANRLADDVASMLSWWQSQDPTHVPRFDLADFGGRRCLDISYVRLPQPAAQIAGGDEAFTVLRDDLIAQGFAHPFKDYLVYYDGPVPAGETDLCGVGAGDYDQGPGYAAVLLQACTGVPTDTVATHELLHAFGAVAPGDPGQCPPPNAGHVCDDDHDVLYPYASGDPLSSLVLDSGHDDYYGMPAADTWPDIQDSLWMHAVGAPQETLAVAFSGSGSVVSDLPGASCRSTCSSTWDQGSTVTLAAVAGTRTRFVRWSGACTGSADCTVTLDAPTSVTAVFGPTRIALRLTTRGRGVVECTPRCARSFPAGDPLTLRAVPAHGWRFAGWSGACSGRAVVCRPATDFAVSARASFVRR
ncbi:MAG TPA: hypothetical protein VFA05_02375 [Gaiellaceae bacterium]|nr:hypothetical protein [Gaiellaceae bacterium]